MSNVPESVAADFYAALETAWNGADGPAFGAAFGEGTDFVDIRGVHHRGGPAELGSAHQHLFDTIYRGSIVRYEVEAARALGDDLVLAHARATLRSPVGPLAGIRHASSSVLIAHDGVRWRGTAFHNTLVAT